MNVFLTTLFTSLSGQMLKILNEIICLATESFKFLNGKRKDKKEKESSKKQEILEKNIDNIVDKGCIKDLLDIGDYIK